MIKWGYPSTEQFIYMSKNPSEASLKESLTEEFHESVYMHINFSNPDTVGVGFHEKSPNKPIIFFGVVPVSINPDTGQTWTIYSKRYKKFPLSIIRSAPEVMARWKQSFDVLKASTFEEHSVKWLESIGFEQNDDVSYIWRKNTNNDGFAFQV